GLIQQAKQRFFGKPWFRTKPKEGLPRLDAPTGKRNGPKEWRAMKTQEMARCPWATVSCTSRTRTLNGVCQSTTTNSCSSTWPARSSTLEKLERGLTEGAVGSA